eukprot:3593-Heterococcus_DN1.PRE.1
MSASTASSLVQLPFAPPSLWQRLLKQYGRILQGNDSAHTHTGTLRYAFDFALPEGAIVLAAKDGTVVAITDHFSEGGTERRLLPRSNFIALKHADGLYSHLCTVVTTMCVTMLLCGHCDNSRYYHLQKGGATAQLGQTVTAGAAIARSGNTGYSDTPHLHFDMVDLLPEDCCTLTITTMAAAEATAVAAQQSVSMTIAAVPALFSGLITAAGTGSCLLVSADDVTELPQWQQPAILLLHRSGARTFVEDINAALDLCQRSGKPVAAVIVANNTAGPELFQMSGRPCRLAVPA